MPTDSTKAQKAITELPPGLTLEDLQTTLNDRIRDLNSAFQGLVQSPAIAAADLGTQQIINLADPAQDLDGVNLRTLKRFAGQGGTTTPVAASGPAAYTIVFTFDGLPFDGQISPSFTVNQLRDGFSPVVVSLTAEGAPATECSVNLLIGDKNVLTADLVLPAAGLGPVYSQQFAIRAMPAGTKIRASINLAGNSSQVVVELVMGR